MALGRTYLIDVQTLNKYGYVHGNVEPDVVLQTIFRTQESQIQPVLGTPLFKKIKAKLAEWQGAGTGSGDYYSLWTDYIIPALVPMVEVKMTFHTISQITNKTTGSNSDEHIRTNELSAANNLRDELNKDVAYFRDQLAKHLCDDNGEKYPEYKERSCNREGFNPEGGGPFYADSFTIV